MKETFITKIKIQNHKRLKSKEIDLSNCSLKHIIITGENGCGKTTLMDSINTFLNSLNVKEYTNVMNLNKDIKECNNTLEFLRDEEILTEVSKGEINKLKNRIDFYNMKKDEFCNGLEMEIASDEELQKKFDIGEFLFIYYKSRRNIDITKEGDIEKFIDYLYQLKDRYDEALAIDDEEEKIIIQRWFNMFERILKVILLNKEVKFYLDEEDNEYKIKEKNREAYTIYDLSDGHSTILKIFMEIMSKMEKVRTNKYDAEGIVLIDEIEKHIHPKLQKEILPLLINTFPNIQFIVTTMSSNVIESMKNSYIYDLNKC